MTGVRTGHGAIGADVTVDATGRRSAIDGWLRELRPLGARETSLQRAECGLAYYSRHYRIRPGALPPGALPPGSQQQRKVATLDEFLAGVWPADNGTVQVAIAPLAADRRFRAIRDAGVFTAVLQLVPSLAPTRCAAWLAAAFRWQRDCTPSATPCAPRTRRWPAAWPWR